MSLDRRQFMSASALAGLGLMGASVAESRDMQRMPFDVASGESRKAWAQRALRGGESFVMPSMQPDLRTLDEEGIRRDVRHAIAQGFCSIMPLPLGIDAKTEKRFYEVVADEAKGKILTVGVIRAGTWEEWEDRVRQMESQGFSHALMYFNPKLASQEAMYQQMRSVVEKTSLGIVLYASPSPAVERFDPTGLPMDAFDRLADLDNVIGIKFTQELRPATALTIADRLGDRLQLAVVDLEVMMLLALKYPMQWTGQWAIDSVQSPDQPWVGEFLELLRTGDLRSARELYWRYEPIASGFYALQRPSLVIGGHPWIHIKYMKWLTGGNGGLLPDLRTTPEMVPHLDAEGRRLCRGLFAKVGIKTTDLPDEAFIVGNAAYERGIRVKDFGSLPQYS
ncbi:MAG TPA: dihydrodipicolinate synthase family protein [Steroidobacteraceae bacterium]